MNIGMESRMVAVCAWRPVRARMILLIGLMLFGAGGCATIRVTDPPRTATEQFLLTVASARAVDQLSADTLRDRKVYIDATYLASSPSQEQAFMIGELRAKLLMSGVRLMEKREQAAIIVEIRSGGIGVDRLEYLLGIPAIYLPQQTNTGTGANATVPVTTPELALLKSTKQKGFASIAFIAYWMDSGEVITSSGPFVGKTLREDWWILGFGPHTVGTIPPAEK